MAIDDSIAVQGQGTTTPGALSLIKTLAIPVKTASGQTVEVQGVILVDEYGGVSYPMSETTGIKILETLVILNNNIALLGGGIVIKTGT